VKCRGREYLRIIYGPEYTAPEHLARLRQRALGSKRALAQREFALGLEALERFVRGEPLYRVHECVFGVLALESEPVDPRLCPSSAGEADAATALGAEQAAVPTIAAMPAPDTYVSVDVEADGRIPGEASMLSIGAVAVDQADQTFYAELKP